MSGTRTRREIKRKSRSVRLRKYGIAYEECMKKTMEIYNKRFINSSSNKKLSSDNKKTLSIDIKKTSSTDKKNRINNKSNKILRKPKNSKEHKRPLNEYQKFVREESKKIKYKGMEATERMYVISKAWRKRKYKDNIDK